MRLFFCNGHFSITEPEWRAKFEQFGVVHKCLLIIDSKTGRSKGYGFITMNRQDALVAVASLDGHWIKHRRLVVKEALSRQEAKERECGNAITDLTVT